MSRTSEPTVITQGEQIAWTRSFKEHHADLWTLEYRFRGSGTGFNVDATANGQSFDAEITATQSLAMSPGRYQWQAWVTNIAASSDTEMIFEGEIDVRRGFATGETGTVDLRSKAKQIVDALDAALLVAGSDAVVEYEISTPAGTHRVRKSRTEALEQRKYYAAIVSREIRAERVRKGGKFAKAVKVSFFER
jgi:hypothetical protein